MNEHAKSIYQASLDGRTVQIARGGFNNMWVDMDPFESNDMVKPHKFPGIWRIKPSTETQAFRVYLHKLNNSPGIFRGSIPQENFERFPRFGGWLTDWMSYEVEVEK